MVKSKKVNKVKNNKILKSPIGKVKSKKFSKKRYFWPYWPFLDLLNIFRELNNNL